MNQVANAGIYLSDNKMVWRRQLAVKPERLWDAVATKDGLRRWFMPTKFEIRQGGRFSFEQGWDGVVSEVEPLHHVQFDGDGDSGGYLRFEIEANEDGCMFSLTDSMGDGTEDPEKIFGPDTPPHLIYQPGGPDGVLGGPGGRRVAGSATGGADVSRTGGGAYRSGASSGGRGRGHDGSGKDGSRGCTGETGGASASSGHANTCRNSRSPVRAKMNSSSPVCSSLSPRPAVGIGGGPDTCPRAALS